MAIDRFDGEHINVTIANGQTTSAEIDLSGLQLVGVWIPAAITGTTMTFTAATATGGTFSTIYEVAGAASYSITIGASRFIPIDPRVFSGLRYIKLVAGSAQAADRVITITARPLS